jgi:hypothetical protein
MMVIVYTSIKNILFIFKQQGNLTFYATNLLSYLSSLTYALEEVFSFFSFTRLI